MPWPDILRSFMTVEAEISAISSTPVLLFGSHSTKEARKTLLC
jgi:hypothetical protein